MRTRKFEEILPFVRESVKEEVVGRIDKIKKCRECPSSHDSTSQMFAIMIVAGVSPVDVQYILDSQSEIFVPSYIEDQATRQLLSERYLLSYSPE
jgi:hypothetical protein